MARKLFEEQGIRIRRGPLVTTGTVFVVYTDPAGVTLADISATSGGSAIAGSAITVADIAGLGPAAFRFYGPPDGTDTLYLRCPSDVSLGVQEVEADEDERLDALEAGGGGGGGVHPDLADHDGLGLATDAELATHATDTTSVHGIADTTALATASSVTSAVSGHEGAVNPHPAYATDTDLVAHEADTSVHGIADTTVLATDAEVASAVSGHTGAADPHGDRAYADAVAQGLDVKAAVQVASTANLTLSGEQTIDGVLTSADRVLVKNQAAGEDNGIYVSAAGAWARATDADTGAEIDGGTFVFVEGGTVNGGTGWAQTADPVTLGTTPLVFSQFSAAGTIIGGAGLVKTGNTLDVGAGTGLAVAADTVGIAPGGVSGTELAASAVTNAKVAAAAAVAESKLALNFPTHAENHAARHAAAGADPLTGYATSADLGVHESAIDPHQGYALESAHTLAAHDTLGLATDAELSAHAGAADPHTGYALESAHTLAAHDILGLATDTELATRSRLIDLLAPPSLPGLHTWLAADRITGVSSGSPVTTWADSSGNNHHVTQVNAVMRPDYFTGIIGGLPALQFDGADKLVSTSFTALPRSTIFAVVKATTTSGSQDYVDGSGGRHQIGIRTGAWESYAGNSLSNGGAANTSPHVLSAAFTGTASSFIAVDGTASAAVDVGEESLTALAVGGQPAFGGEDAVGHIAEVVVFNRVLTGVERQQIEWYLGAKYGITVAGSFLPGNYLAAAIAIAREDAKPAYNDMVYFVAGSGHDDNDGLSWGTAKRTITAALGALSGPGTINVGRALYTETVDLTNRRNVRIIGTAALLGEASQITPPNDSASALILSGSSNCVFESLVFSAATTTWNGVMVDMNESSNGAFLQCSWTNPTGSATASTGGTGLQIGPGNSEGWLFLQPFFSEFNLGLHLVEEATENVFIALKGATNWREILIEGNCGGNTFLFTKWNNPKDSTEYQVDIGGNGQTWIHADWSETNQIWSTKSRVTSDHNRFIRGASSPQNTMEVSGSYNIFDQFTVAKQHVVTGTGNEYRSCFFHRGGGSNALDNSGGTGTIIDNPRILNSTITYGAALTSAYRAVGAALATNATSGFLYIPTCAGTPTGTPVAETGMVALVFDTTNAKLYIYSGGSWKGGTVPGVFS